MARRQSSAGTEVGGATEDAPKKHLSMSADEFAALPVSIDIATAARALGMHANTARAMARANTFPCPVILHGRRYTVPTAALRRLLETGKAS